MNKLNIENYFIDFLNAASDGRNYLFDINFKAKVDVNNNLGLLSIYFEHILKEKRINIEMNITTELLENKDIVLYLESISSKDDKYQNKCISIYNYLCSLYLGYEPFIYLKINVIKSVVKEQSNMIYLCNHIYFYTDISLFSINCIVKILKLSYTQSKLMIENNVYKVYSDRAMYIYPVRVTNFNRFFCFPYPDKSTFNNFNYNFVWSKLINDIAQQYLYYLDFLINNFDSCFYLIYLDSLEGNNLLSKDNLISFRSEFLHYITYRNN